MHMTHSRFRLFAGVVALGMLCTPLLASAADYSIRQQVSIPVVPVNGNMYAVGGTVTSAAAIEGDLVAAGGTVIIRGPVSSDVLIGGGTVTVLDDVGGDVRIVGGNVIIQGKVGGDIISAGGQLNIGGAGVGGDVAVAGASVHIDAPVSGNVRIAGGQVVINAPITGNVQIQAKTVTLGSNANIKGDLIYTATQPATIESGAVVSGATRYAAIPDARKVSMKGIAALVSLGLFFKLLMMLCAAFAIGFGLRSFSQKVVETAVAKPWNELGRGLIFSIVAPVVSFMLLCTLVGVPLGMLGFTVAAAVTLIAGLVASIVTGSVLFRWFTKAKRLEITWKTISLGTVAYFLLGLIPVIGWLLACALMLMTLGAVLKITWGVVQTWR